MNETRLRLRKLLSSPQMVVAPFIYDCLQARIAQRAGFNAVYMTGFGTAASRGVPPGIAYRARRQQRDTKGMGFLVGLRRPFTTCARQQREYQY